ncbi:MAG: MBL fold metallo-hydrolase [Desulfobacteraceae bacterium]|jgi:glyoxylase-like metal-dependent hydrolase (beta-lactamase superfamily II)
MDPMEPTDGLFAFLWTDPAVNNCNTYLIQTDRNILLDPGHLHLFDRLRNRLARRSLNEADMDVVLVTHGHPDHLEAIQAFSRTQALAALHVAERDFLREMGAQSGNGLTPGGGEPDFLLEEGELRIGDEPFQVLHTPGHSPGSFCLYWPRRKALFSGDVVFSGGLGRTDLPGGDGHALKASIQRLSSLEVDLLLPGHGEIVSGSDAVKRNFQEIEEVWFAYL